MTDNVLARAVVLVRKAIGDDARAAKYVHTVPTRGYKFVARRYASVRTERQLNSTPEHDRDRTGDASPITIAVLPFVNAGGDARDRAFLRWRQRRHPQRAREGQTFRVAARSSSFAFRGGAVDVRTIAEQLGVAFVLDGSVRRTADRVRITAHLVDAETGYNCGVSDSIAISPISLRCRTRLRSRSP